MGDDGAKVKGIVESVFKGLDETISEYMVSVLSDDPHQSVRLFSIVGMGWSGAVLDELGKCAYTHLAAAMATTDRPTTLPTHKHQHIHKPADLEASVGPFLLSADYAQGDDEVAALCAKLGSALSDAFGGAGGCFERTNATCQ